jgi:excisionase family DNA binding protein
VSDRLLRAREVAEMLGMSTDWVLDKWEARELPGFRLSSRAVRFRESEILDWLESRRGERKPQESCVDTVGARS